MASNTRFKGSKHPDISGLVRKRNRADTTISSISSTLPGRPSSQRQKRESSVEVTDSRVLPPEEVETVSDVEVKGDDSAEDYDFDQEDEEEELAFQGLASQELISPTPDPAQVSMSDIEPSESLQTPGLPGIMRLGLALVKFGPGVAKMPPYGLMIVLEMPLLR
jgi:hypothetical protein